MMMKKLAALSLLTLAIFLPRTASCDPREQDQIQIRQVETKQAAAWNAHDAKAYAGLFTEDGDCVNVLGWWWKGRAEIEQKLTDAYAFVFRESVLTIKDVTVKFMGPDTAVAHVRWTMTGARTPQGISPPQEGIQTQMLQKQAGQWLIAVFQNTNSIPERPFPKGPPPTEK